MMTIKFTVPGIPVGKGRPRVTRHGTYNPKRTVQYQNLVRKAYGSNPRLSGSVFITLAFYFPVPVSYTKKKRLKIANDSYCYTKKPDIDNCCKAVMDALNGLAYEDDSCVYAISACKLYCVDDTEPRAEVSISTFKEE